MPISNRLADGLDKVDVIICGGGTAACVVAGRLAESDPNLSVLVVEGGENNDGKPTVEHPGLFLGNLVPNSTTAAVYQGQKSDKLAGRAPVVHTGGTLGGGSSINFMVYSRAQGVDFDAWKSEGWSAKEIIPFMKKLENYHGNGKANHGYSGPVQIGDGGLRGTKTQEDTIKTAERLGYTIYDDLQNPENFNDGFERCMKYVTTDGRRADAAHAYIHPLLQDGKHPNLHVLCESKVVRVLFNENKRAVGVEYISNPALQPATNLSLEQKLTVKARKMVVVSSGACGTPSILERSGVGSKVVLEKASVPLVAEVPGVGQNYDDHQLVCYAYETNLSIEDTNDALWRGEMPMEEAAEKGHLGWTANDVHGKFRPTEEEVAALGPKFQATWDRDYKNQPNRPLMMLATMAGFLGDPSAIPKGQYFALGVYSCYNYSRGHLHITGPNYGDAVDFVPGYLSDADDIDLKMHVWAYKRARQLFLSTPFCTSETAFLRPRFAEGSEAAGSEPNPKYTAEDDEAIAQFIRENVGTTWHSMGTAKMAPLEQDGVVDSKLNVYGVKGLKCVDLSIAPQMVAANTNNTAYVVGERGADIIMGELRLANGTANGVVNGIAH